MKPVLIVLAVIGLTAIGYHALKVIKGNFQRDRIAHKAADDYLLHVTTELRMQGLEATLNLCKEPVAMIASTAIGKPLWVGCGIAAKFIDPRVYTAFREGNKMILPSNVFAGFGEGDLGLELLKEGYYVQDVRISIWVYAHRPERIIATGSIARASRTIARL